MPTMAPTQLQIAIGRDLANGLLDAVEGRAQDALMSLAVAMCGIAELCIAPHEAIENMLAVIAQSRAAAKSVISKLVIAEVDRIITSNAS